MLCPRGFTRTSSEIMLWLSSQDVETSFLSFFIHRKEMHSWQEQLSLLFGTPVYYVFFGMFDLLLHQLLQSLINSQWGWSDFCVDALVCVIVWLYFGLEECIHPTRSTYLSCSLVPLFCVIFLLLPRCSVSQTAFSICFFQSFRKLCYVWICVLKIFFLVLDYVSHDQNKKF